MKALNSVRNFLKNFRDLLRHSELRSLEFFLGAFCLLWGLCRFLPPFGPITDAERSSPSPLFATVMTIAGIIMIVGAVQNLHPWRKRACFLGNAIWLTVLLFNIASVMEGQGLIAERVLTPLYFLLIFSWLTARVMHELPKPKEGDSVGGYERLDHPSGIADNRTGRQCRYTENHRSAAGRT